MITIRMNQGQVARTYSVLVDRRLLHTFARKCVAEAIVAELRLQRKLGMLDVINRYAGRQDGEMLVGGVRTRVADAVAAIEKEER